MLTTTALFCGLLFSPVVDKVDLSHNFTKGTNLAYNIKIDVTGDTNISASVLLKWTYGDKDEKGVKTVVKPENLAVNINGEDHSEPLSETTFLLDQSGMPDSFSMDGPETLMVIAHVATFLPAKTLDAGESFTIDWKRDSATMKGTGKFEGMEKVDGKDLAKLSMKVTLSPKGDDSGVGTLDYVSYFDPATGHVQSAKGTGSVDSHEFKFSMALAPTK